MSCSQSTNACHIVGQAMTVIIIVSQRNAVQEAPWVNLWETDSGKTQNSYSNCLKWKLSTYQLLENIHTHSHITQAVRGNLYSGLFFSIFFKQVITSGDEVCLLVSREQYFYQRLVALTEAKDAPCGTPATPKFGTSSTPNDIYMHQTGPSSTPNNMHKTVPPTPNNIHRHQTVSPSTPNNIHRHQTVSPSTPNNIHRHQTGPSPTLGTTHISQKHTPLQANCKKNTTHEDNYKKAHITRQLLVQGHTHHQATPRRTHISKDNSKKTHPTTTPRRTHISLGQLQEEHTLQWGQLQEEHTLHWDNSKNTQFTGPTPRTHTSLGQLQAEHRVHWANSKKNTQFTGPTPRTHTSLGQLQEEHTVHWANSKKKTYITRTAPRRTHRTYSLLLSRLTVLLLLVILKE